MVRKNEAKSLEGADVRYQEFIQFILLLEYVTLSPTKLREGEFWQESMANIVFTQCITFSACNFCLHKTDFTGFYESC